MFRREQHRRVLKLLEALDAPRLSQCGFRFGGGTRIVLDLQEYRESKDVDFLCADSQGYGELRFAATRQGYDALFPEQDRAGLSFPREMKIDQYGIRFPVEIEGEWIRVELIREARISLDAGIKPSWSPVDCLSVSDCYAEKLLANSDRWADRQFLSRDLLDLAALRQGFGPIPSVAWAKVQEAYRDASRLDLEKALALFSRDGDHQERCLKGLQIENRQLILEGLEHLRLETAL